jgi:hypothetical protein
MWDDVKEETGKQHEKELSDFHWKSMLNDGSCMSRFMNTNASAWEIVDTVLNRNPVDVSIIQKELGQALETPVQPGRRLAGIFAFLFSKSRTTRWVLPSNSLSLRHPHIYS